MSKQLLLLTLSTFLFAGMNSSNAQTSHQVFNDLLNKHVSSDGAVSYKGFQSEEAKLDKYLANLKANHPNKSWPRNERLAYWINAYNAFTIKLILDNMPTTSIMDIYGGKAWDVKWIELGSSFYSLNQIENDIIRPVFQEPRIHFAVNCAAKSCPPLRNEAYTAATLNDQLEEQTRKFIRNSQFNSLKAKEIKISKIFEWYAVDFPMLIKFLNDYSTIKISPNAKITYFEYDWNLNRK